MKHHSNLINNEKIRRNTSAFDYLIIHSPKGIAEQLRLANFKSISFRPDFLNHFVFLAGKSGRNQIRDLKKEITKGSLIIR